MKRSSVMISAAAIVGCIYNPVEFNPEPAITPPVFLDLPGETRPRLGNLVNRTLSSEQTTVAVEFSVPFEDLGVTEYDEYRFLIDGARDCVPTDGGIPCTPTRIVRGFAPPNDNGSTRRTINETIALEQGCHRVELWVSARFVDNSLREPRRSGDVAFTTWWIFVRPNPPATVDPETCRVVAP